MAVAAVFFMPAWVFHEALRSILLCQVLIMAGAVTPLLMKYRTSCTFSLSWRLMGLQTLPALLGFVLVPLPFLIAAVKTDKIGGGDVKLMAASGFALGVTGGVWMMVWGCLWGFYGTPLSGVKHQASHLRPFWPLAVLWRCCQLKF